MSNEPRVIASLRELRELPHGSAVLTSDFTDTVVLKDVDVFRNQSGFEITPLTLWEWGSKPFTVLYSPKEA